MRRRRRLRHLRLTLVFIAGMAVIGIYVWGFVAGNPTIVTAATALLVLVIGEHRRWQLAAQQDRWGRIAPQYEAFLSHLRSLVSGDRRAKQEAQARTEEVMGDFGDKLMLWGSAGVIRAWVAMRRQAESGPPTVADSMSAYGRLILAIRKEFGHQDISLEEKDIFRVIFNDELETLLAIESA